MRGDRDRRVDRGEDAPDFLFDEIAKARAVARPGPDGRDDPIGGGDADVGRDQQLLERVDRLDVDRPAAPFRGVGDLDDLVEPLDDLLLGAGEAVAQAGKDAHGVSGNWVIG